MKKVLAVTAALVVAAALAYAQQVLSRNAVGYQLVTFQKGKMAMVAHTFEPLGSTPADQLTISNVFASLPNGATIYLWKPDQSGYDTVQKQLLGGWGSGGSNVLTRGRGFWVKLPGTVASNEYHVYMMGEVPDRFTAPTTTVPVAAGLTMASYAYPVEMYWTNTSLAKMAPNGSVLHTWNGTNYTTYQKTLLGGWGASGNALVLLPGQGFWLKWASATNWQVAKPYTWP